MRATVFLICLLVAGVANANADPKGDIEKKIKTAMESYDLMDYDAAKKSLNQALAAAKKNKLDKDPVAARAYLDLGIVAFVNNDPDAAKLSFLSAVQIQPKIQIDPAYKSPEMAKLLEEARSEAKGGSGDKGDKGGSEPAADSGADCTGVKGIDHQIIDSAKAGAALAVEAKVGSDVKSSRVSVMFRAEGASDFTEVKMKKEGDCKYVATIPASGMKGGMVHYYVAAYGEGPKPIASKGSAGSPNIIELTAGGGAAATAAKDDKEDPINGGKAKPAPKVAQVGGDEGPKDTGADVTSGVTVPGKAPKVLIGVSAGVGGGYLASCMTSCTEGQNPVRNPGMGPSWLVLQPEVSFFVKPQLALGIAGRIGLPLDANVNGHATLAPAGLARVHYYLADNGEGVNLMGQIGAGIIRNTVKLDNSMPGMDTDVYASGPLLVGAGAGYQKRIGGSVMFLANLSVLAAINVGGADAMGNSSITGVPLNSGIQFDLSLGLALGL